MRRASAAISLACALGALAVGCGEEGGVASGATVRVYVSVPLHGAESRRGREACRQVRKAVGLRSGRVEDVHVDAVCLDDTAGSSHWTLTAVGADARRATEDSAAVGYIGELDPAATRFSAPILETAEVPRLPAADASASATKLLDAIARALESGPGSSLRESVSNELK